MSIIPFAVDLSVKPEVTAFFDEPTNTVSYVVKDPGSNACAIIDSVMDIDYAAGRIAYESADAIIAFIQKNDLKLEWLIETHVHADHLSGAPYIKASSAARSASAKKSRSCRRPSARFSTKARNSSGTEASSTVCSRMATPIGSAQ